MSNEVISGIQLSEKVNKIQLLPSIDNKDTVVQEIEALEVFTENERSSIFGNSSIVWILKTYTIQELKDKALAVLQKPDIKVGDVVKFSTMGSLGIVLEITGEYKDRLSLMYKEISEYNSIFGFIEGVSIYNVVKTNKTVDISFLNVFNV